jgi:hypothetical protein
MKRLAVCAYPGDETTLFGNAILSGADDWSAILGSCDEVDGATGVQAFEQWRHACADLGVQAVGCLFLPGTTSDYDVQLLRDMIRPLAVACDEVFIPSVEDNLPLRRALSVAFAQEYNCLRMESAFGEYICTVDTAGYERLVLVLNHHYATRLRVGRIDLHDLRGTRHYRVISGDDLVRFEKDFLSMETSCADPCNPWDIGVSEYERTRHALELDVLRRLSWSSLIEVGACTGIFTEKLANAFPERNIVAYEPARQLHAELARRIGDKVEVVNGPIDSISGQPDLLLISSVLYYLDNFPSRILHIPRRWLVLSHLRTYHDAKITPLLLSAGWMCVSRDELPPRIERFRTIPVLKDGTEVAVWERT